MGDEQEICAGCGEYLMDCQCDGKGLLMRKRDALLREMLALQNKAAGLQMAIDILEGE